MTRFRPFRNSDPPALVRLWNQAIPPSATARPLRVHELDTHAFGVVPFEAPGLIVGERNGRIVGFVHAGFGPELALASIPPFQLGFELGTIAMLVVEPGLDDQELAPGLLAAAEHYLRARGAKVVYAGGLFPLNPFYWGLYGGSEGSGVLSGHESFHRALIDRGYQPVSSTVLLEADLSNPEPRDPRAALIRRQTQVEFLEDALPANWWENLGVGHCPLTAARLLNKSDGSPLAHASIWDMQGFDREDGRSRIGLINLEVVPDYRRKGFGRFLVSEILRRARANLVGLVEVQTAASNQPALALYASLGFVPIEHSTLYRLP
ncbi:MAG TPA: GNAT family N-acetyltransferase [Isosphaeraceae bacterium]|nr:GNAT family N-acetyltransferase [Isosphaeraceae bacterium]